MKSSKYLVNVLVAVLFFSFVYSLAIAETIYLKSGTTVEGKIIEKTDKYIKVNFEGIELTFFLDEIEKIEGVQTTSDIQASSLAAPESLEGYYVNEEYGFRMKGPNGWFMHTDIAGSPQAVIFTKEPTEKINFPMFGVTIDIPPEDILSAFEFAKFVLPQYQASAQKHNAVFKLIESPREIEVNGVKGARFIFEQFGQDGRAMQSTDYKFMKGNIIISLQGMDRPEAFEKNRRDLEESINSFVFLAPEDDFIELEKLNLVQLNLQPLKAQPWQVLKEQVTGNMQTKSSFKAIFILKDKTEPKLSKNNYRRMTWLMTFVAPQSFEVDQSDYYNGVGDIWRVVGDEVYSKIGGWIPHPADTGNQQINQMLQARKEIYKAFIFEQYLALFNKETPTAILENVLDKYTVIQFKPMQLDDLFTGKPREEKFNNEVLIWVANKDKTIRFAKTRIDGIDTEGKEIKWEYEHYFSNFNFPFQLGKPDAMFDGEQK